MRNMIFCYLNLLKVEGFIADSGYVRWVGVFYFVRCVKLHNFRPFV